MTDPFDQASFSQCLVDHGLIIPTGVKGAYGRGPVFEDILGRFDDLVMRLAKKDGASEMTFPPIVARSLVERLGYLDSFPQLIGSIHSFSGPELQAREMADLAREGKRWEGLLDITEVMLTPAACYPFYPLFSGLLPDGGRLVTTMAWCYRHEPSDEPTRLQAFRVREFVRLGAPEEVESWRDSWLQRGLELLTSLNLPASPDTASDPFFGRAGKLMATSQLEQRLKFEIVVPVISKERPTAVCSFNWHQEHFTSVFGISRSGGRVAHTACLGFGLERVTLALIKTHGFEPDRWPASVREQLWP